MEKFLVILFCLHVIIAVMADLDPGDLGPSNGSVRPDQGAPTDDSITNQDHVKIDQESLDARSNNRDHRRQLRQTAQESAESQVDQPKKGSSLDAMATFIDFLDHAESLLNSDVRTFNLDKFMIHAIYPFGAKGAMAWYSKKATLPIIGIDWVKLCNRTNEFIRKLLNPSEPNGQELTGKRDKLYSALKSMQTFMISQSKESLENFKNQCKDDYSSLLPTVEILKKASEQWKFTRPLWIQIVKFLLGDTIATMVVQEACVVIDSKSSKALTMTTWTNILSFLDKHRSNLEQKEDTDWNYLNMRLINFVSLFLEQEEEYANLAYLEQEKPTISSSDLEIIRSSIQMNKGTRKFHANLRRLVVTIKQSWMSNTQFSTDYHNARKLLKDLLMNFTLTAETPGMKAYFRPDCDKDTVGLETIRSTIVSLTAQTSKQLSESLSPAYDRRRFLHWSKVLIGDLIGYQIIQGVSCKNLDKTELINRDVWSTIQSLIQAERHIFNAWHQVQLEQDIKEFSKVNSNPNLPWSGAHHSSLSAYLNEKYYWCKFRVHIYQDQYARDARVLKGSTSLYIPLDTDKVAVVVNWNSFETLNATMGKKVNRQAIASSDTTEGRSPGAAPSAITPGPAEYMEKYMGIAQSTSDFLQEFTQKSGDEVTEIATKMKDGVVGVAKASGGFWKKLKTVLNFLGNVGKFFGPIAGSVSAFLSLRDETGIADVFNAVQKGFHEMHNRFDIVERMIIESKNEIKEKIESSIQYHTNRIIYDQDIRIPLDLLLQAHEDGRGLNKDIYGMQETLRAACNPNGQFMPGVLIDRLEAYYFPRDGRNTFTKAIAEWAKDQKPDEVQEVIFLLSMDAMKIGLLATTGCLSEDSTGYGNAAFRALKGAEASRTTRKIFRALLDAYDQYLYGWQYKVEGIVKTAYNDAQKKEKDEILGKVDASLKDQFRGINFYVFGFEPYKDDNYNSVYHWIGNPDYCVFVVVDKWKIFVTWHLEASKGTEITLPPKVLNENTKTDGKFWSCHAKELKNGSLQNALAKNGAIKAAIMIASYDSHYFQYRGQKMNYVTEYKYKSNPYCCSINEKMEMAGFKYSGKQICKHYASAATNDIFGSGYMSKQEFAYVFEATLANAGEGF